MEEQKVSYFEQLGVLPHYRYRSMAVPLAMSVLEDIFTDGHEHLFITTVHAPFTNMSALYLLKRCGATTIGRIQEQYDGYGKITSDIYCSRGTYQQKLLSLANEHPWLYTQMVKYLATQAQGCMP